MSSPDERPGLARERTALAWQRSAFGYVTLGALTLGVAAHRNTSWMALPAAGLFAVGAVLWVYWHRRANEPTAAARAGPLRWLTAATVAAAVMAAALTVVAQPG